MPLRQESHSSTHTNRHKHVWARMGTHAQSPCSLALEPLPLLSFLLGVAPSPPRLCTWLTLISFFKVYLRHVLFWPHCTPNTSSIASLSMLHILWLCQPQCLSPPRTRSQSGPALMGGTPLSKWLPDRLWVSWNRDWIVLIFVFLASSKVLC